MMSPRSPSRSSSSRARTDVQDVLTPKSLLLESPLLQTQPCSCFNRLIPRVSEALEAGLFLCDMGRPPDSCLQGAGRLRALDGLISISRKY